MTPGKYWYQILLVYFSASLISCIVFFRFNDFIHLIGFEILYAFFIAALWLTFFRKSSLEHLLVPFGILVMIPYSILYFIVAQFLALPFVGLFLIYPFVCLFIILYSIQMLRGKITLSYEPRQWIVTLAGVIIWTITVFMLGDSLVYMFYNMVFGIALAVLAGLAVYAREKDSWENEPGTGAGDFLRARGLSVSLALLFVVYMMVWLAVLGLPVYGSLAIGMSAWLLQYFAMLLPAVVSLGYLIYSLCMKKQILVSLFLVGSLVVILPVVPIILDDLELWTQVSISSTLVYALMSVLAFALSLWISIIAGKVASERGVTILGVFLTSLLAGMLGVLTLFYKTMKEVIQPMLASSMGQDSGLQYAQPVMVNIYYASVLCFLLFASPFVYRARMRLFWLYGIPLIVYVLISVILSGPILSILKI